VMIFGPKVVALDLPRGGRFRAWVDWNELTMPVENARLSSVVYYLRETDSGLKTEMVEYTRLSMPELAPQLAAMGMAA
jgi:hypothetical protein